MNTRIFAFTLIYAALIVITIALLFVSRGVFFVQEQVLGTQENASIEDPGIVKAIFSLGEAAFFTQPHACEPPFLDQAYVNVHLRYHEVPRSCTVFVNDRYVSTERSLQPDCIGECPYDEFSRTLSLGVLDVRDPHAVKVCCNDICLTRALPAACTAAGSSPP